MDGDTAMVHTPAKTTYVIIINLIFIVHRQVSEAAEPCWVKRTCPSLQLIKITSQSQKPFITFLTRCSGSAEKLFIEQGDH